MAGCFGNDPYDRYLESQVMAHCDDSGELSDEFMDDLGNCLMGEKSSQEAKDAIKSNLKEGEAVVYEGKVCILVNNDLWVLKEIDWDTLTERMVQDGL
jgi:hypothetical protein